MASSVVSQWGPNPQGVRSRPDRSVSLRDVRELPVQKAGGLEEFLFWSRENPRPYGMSGEPRDVSKLSARARAWVESMGFDVEDLHEPMADDLEDLAEAEIDERDTGEVFDERQRQSMERDYQRILDDRQQQVDDAEAAAAAWQDAERDASVGDPEWDGFPVEEMRGLTADEAFRQHLAMSGRADPNQGYFPEFEGPNERIDRDRREAKENVRPKTPEEQEAWERELRERFAPRPEPQAAPPPPPPPPPSNRIASLVSQMSGPDFDAIEEGDYGSTPWWDSVPGLDDIPEFDDPYGEEGEFNPWDPDARSMDSQMLADLNMRRAQQDQQGYFGGLGDAVSSLTDTVSNMSNTERAGLVAALVAAGIITIGSGGTMAPAGAALLGGAGLGALSSAP